MNDEDGKPVTNYQILEAIADGYRSVSRFKPVREIGREYATRTSDPKYQMNAMGQITREPAKQGLMHIKLAGLRTSVLRPPASAVKVDYLNIIQSSGNEIKTSTNSLLVLSPIPSKPGHYLLESKSLKEDTGIYALMPIKKLAESHEIADDIVQSITAMRPAIRLYKTVTEEFEAKYLPVPVFANYKKRLVPEASSKQTKGERVVQGDADVREDSFYAQYYPDKSEAVNSGVITVKVRPYRSASKVEVQLKVPYYLYADGTSSYSNALTKSVFDKMKNIANE